MQLHHVLGGKLSILDMDTQVKLAIGLIAVLSGVIFNILATLKDTSELDNKREFVSNVLLQRIGPVVGDVYKSYDEYKSKNDETEPPEGPKGGFVENPLGEFETQSLNLTDKLKDWADWKSYLDKSEDYLSYNLIISIIGIVVICLSLVLKAFDENLILSDILILSSVGILIISFIPICYRARVIRKINRKWREIKDSVGGATN